MTIGSWTGTGYISLDKATGAGAYMISGSLNGGAKPVIATGMAIYALIMEFGSAYFLINALSLVLVPNIIKLAGVALIMQGIYVINMMLIAYIDYMATHDEAYFDQFVNWFLKSGLISSIQLECAYFLLSIFWVAEACDDEKEENNAEVEANPENTPETNPETNVETTPETNPEATPETNPVTGQTGGENGNVNETNYGTPKHKSKLWGQEKYVTEKGLNTVKEHLSGKMQDDFNDTMIERLENAYKNNTKISGADLDFYAHEIYESTLMKKGMSYEEAHEAAKAYYNAVEFNFYHPDVIKQYSREFSTPWFSFWGMEKK